MLHKHRVEKTGSGVLIADSSEVNTKDNNCELIFVRIQLKDQKDLIVGSTDQTALMMII